MEAEERVHSQLWLKDKHKNVIKILLYIKIYDTFYNNLFSSLSLPLGVGEGVDGLEEAWIVRLAQLAVPAAFLTAAL